MNLILGTVYNCDFSSLKSFFVSLHKVTKDTDVGVILFTHNMTGPVPEDIMCVPFTPQENQHNLCYRFNLYRDFLSVNPWATKIILTDMRDVVFQADPFEFDYPKGLCCFLEDESKTIGTCLFNSNWVRLLGGNVVYEQVQDKPISCAGVTVGDYPEMLEYLSKMTNMLAGQKSNLDQGAHNILIHQNKLDKVTLFPNARGPVLTMGYMKNPSLQNEDGSTPLILHQYDRHETVFVEIRRRYL